MSSPVGQGAIAGGGATRFPRPATELILPNLLGRRAVETPDRTFVTEVDGESLSYGEVHARATRLAWALRRLGVGDGDRVVTLLPNSVDSVVVLCATALAGAVHVPLNNAYKGTLLQHAISVAEPVVFVVDPRFAERLAEGLVLPPRCVTVWRADPPGASDEGDRDPTLPGLVAGSGSHPVGDVRTIDDWAAVSTLLFTSGTTGPSKAVTIPWLHLYLSSVRIWQAQELTSDTVMYSPWPINHISGTGGVYMTLVVGGELVLREKWSTSSFVDDVKRYGCTLTTLMGEAVGYVRRMSGLEDSPLTHLFISPVTDYADQMMGEIGARYATNYNSTELCSPIGTDGWTRIPAGSCGVPREGVEMRLVDEQGVDVPDGTPGEGLFRTADPAAMNTGYWGMPEASEKAWRGGWFYTGDLLRRDTDGYYYFLGRLKDRLRARGENVSPDELEAVVLRHGDVTQCAAVGRPNEVGEDDIVLYAVVEDGLGVEALRAYCEEALPKFMWPAEIRLVGSLPETPTGKIRRAEVREALLAEDP